MLPRLPVPDLQSSISLLLQALQPVAANDEELRDAEDAARSFLADLGPKLQQRLLKRKAECDQTGSHWLEEWWEKFAYLYGRYPLPINSNVFGTMFSCNPHDRPLERAAKLIYGLVNTHLRIQNGEIPVDMMGQEPLCMHQYSRLFQTSRIPGEGVDNLVVFANNTHIAVNYKDQFFSVRVVDDQGNAVSTPMLYKTLSLITSGKLLSKANTPGIAVLTSGDRDEWARARNELVLDSTNKKVVDAIEQSLFHVCLSDSSPTDPNEIMQLCALGNGRNIWFDKSFTLLMFANGVVGFNGEHTSSDAVVQSNMFESSMQFFHQDEKVDEEHGGFMQRIRAIDHVSVDSLVEPLHFHLEDEAMNDFLQAADTAMKSHMTSMKLQTMVYRKFGRKFLRERKIPPDAFMQVSLQLAFYRDQGRLPHSVYETATTRLFHHGRTDTIRSLSQATKDFVLAMGNSTFSNEHRLRLLQKAMQQHVNYTARATKGHGIDRHLMGLRLLCEGEESSHPLFTNPAVLRSSEWELSTSQMTFTREDFPGFGPPYEYSYGCCYLCQLPDMLVCTVTSHTACDAKDPQRFAGHLSAVLDELSTLIQTAAKL